MKTVAFLFTLAAAAGLSAAAPATTPHEAIARAVAERLGGGFEVTATTLETTVGAEAGLTALPEPGGRSGQPTRFVLMAGRARRGSALATVTITGAYPRAARAIERGDVIGRDAIEMVDGELPPTAFKRLPALADAIGLTARRDIAPGELLSEAVLLLPPLVRTGDAVAVTVRVGAVEITSKGTASGSGHEGDLIRVTPRPGVRPLKARITGPGAVEIVQ